MTDPYRRIARIYDAIVEPFNSTLRSYVRKAARPEVGMKVLAVTKSRIVAGGNIQVALAVRS